MKTLLTKNFFDDPFNFFFSPSVPTSSSMKTDVIETEKEIKLSINLAGFKKEEIMQMLKEKEGEQSWQY